MPDGMTTEGKRAVQNMHQAFLEALRHREQEIHQYLTILAPAVGGFIWLLTLDLAADHAVTAFAAGSIGVMLVLLLGAIYSLSLGFNYRYITLQLAKPESDKVLGIRNVMLKSWPRSAEDFRKRCRKLWFVPWCEPPEIIKFFWLAFLAGIGGVMGVVHFGVMPSQQALAQDAIGAAMLPAGWACLAVGLLGFPVWFGWKMRKACKAEVGKW